VKHRYIFNSRRILSHPACGVNLYEPNSFSGAPAMRADLFAPRRALLRRYLLACYVLMIIYASLSPFTGWQAPTVSFWRVLSAPLHHAYTAFDALTNWLAYFPLGLLLALTLMLRYRVGHSLVLATLAAFLLSVSMEFVQGYLPSRASANIDLLTNTAGAFCGALLAVIIAPQAWFARVTRWRIDLLQHGAGVDFGLALVLLWMFAQINPSLPMLGNVFLAASPVSLPQTAFSLWGGVAVAANLWLIGLLLLTLFRNRQHAVATLLLILCTVALGKFIMAAVLLRSWALMLWLNGEAMLGLLAGLGLLGVSACLRGKALLAVMLLVALAYMLLAFALMDSTAPVGAMRLYHWHYGHLRNFNHMVQIVSALFPLLLWLYAGRAYQRIINHDRRTG